MNFCRRCGTKLAQKSYGVFECEKAHQIFLNAPATASIFFVSEDNEVMMAVRGVQTGTESNTSFFPQA